MSEDEREINELASQLGRHLTLFQMEVSHEIPAPILASQARVIHDVAGQLAQRLEANPHAKVTADTRFNAGMEEAYRDVFGPSTDVPDSPEGLE